MPHIPRKRIVLVLVLLYIRDAKDGFKRLWHADHGDKLYQCLAKSANECFALLWSIVLGLGDEISVQLCCKSRMTATGNRRDLERLVILAQALLAADHSLTANICHLSSPKVLDGNCSSMSWKSFRASCEVGSVRAIPAMSLCSGCYCNPTLIDEAESLSLEVSDSIQSRS